MTGFVADLRRWSVRLGLVYGGIWTGSALALLSRRYGLGS